MENKEATRTCGQCHREVAEANFALHETHCSRFLCLCPDCQESVPRDQLDQHRKEQHTEVRCSKCHKKMERCQLMDHESDECVERLKACQFCELELPWKELAQHCQVCGSRTELCRDCNSYVQLRDLPDHSSTCPGSGDNSSPQVTSTSPDEHKAKLSVSCNGCMVSFPIEDLEKHELECFRTSRWYDQEDDESEGDDGEDEEGLPEQTWISSTFKAASASQNLWGPSLSVTDNPYQIKTCPYCHLALPISTLLWHTAKCQVYIQLK